MAEFLIFNKDETYNKSKPDECYQRGDIITIQDDGWGWGSGEGLPDFVRITVVGPTAESVKQYIQDWELLLDYEIVATNVGQDGARIRVFNTKPGQANEYGITRAKVENWLNGWGASVRSADTNEVVFDVTIQGLYKSEKFWERDPVAAGIVITETNYDQGTGVHTATFDGTNATVNLDAVKIAAVDNGGVITDITGKVATVEFTRSNLRTRFLTALTEALRKTAKRRQFNISEADCDLIVNAGGEMTVTQQQFLNKVLDKA